MSEEGKINTNLIIDALVIAVTAATAAKVMSRISKSLPDQRLAITPYDIGLNMIDLSIGRYTYEFLHNKDILPLIK